MSESLIDIEQLLSDFQESKSWDKQYRLIIQLGKKLPALTQNDKIECNLVNGCESDAWLVLHKEGDIYHLQMDSDSRVVKGLMMIILIIFQGKNTLQIRAIDINSIFVQLGLFNHLSPSRVNGLHAIVNKIKNV
ncbi:SufE family protein [Psychromonas antarctica]|uniref:SufE family protein n=1 Tax=Psychromonas antarctica TaxID=67573 RepID=UPI001EE98F87|nr:SufE family protein [Psychromonas antarctica]